MMSQTKNIRILIADDFKAAILSISMSVEPDLIRRSTQQGVDGFIHKDEIDTDLVKAVQSIYSGQRYLSPKLRRLLEVFRVRSRAVPAPQVRRIAVRKCDWSVL